MAQYENYAGATTSGATSLACNVPSGIQNNQLMIALVIVRGGTVITVPNGFSLIVSAIDFDANGSYAYLYSKIAASESGSYTWEFSVSLRTAISINSFSGVDTTTPVASYSSDAYITNDATVRSASVTTTVANQLVVNFAILSQATQLTFTPPTDFTEHHEYGANRCWAEVSSRNYTNAGATGNIDATMSSSSITKRGIAVVLNNIASSATALPRRVLDGVFYGSLKGSVR